MRNATIRTRVALVATALAVTALVALGYQQLSTMSAAFSRVAEGQSLTLSTQLASATAGAGAEVVGVIPYTDQGLDGVVFFDKQGRVHAADGGLAPQLRRLGPEARTVARTGRPLQQFRKNGGAEKTELRPWSPSSTTQVTLVRQDDGVIAVGFHVDWATTQMRSSALSTSMALVGGALFICFGLMLMLGRMVTRPLGRLASEVRGLDHGDQVEPLSAQTTPELQELASDIWQMHEDLTHALRESSTDPLTGIANHRAFQDRLEPAVASALRSGEPLALVALDLDDLKAINDSCGHIAGDRVLAAVGRELSAACDEHDLCARLGGDEFAILCPGRDRAGAAALGERVAAAVAALSIERLTGAPGPEGLEPAISFGVAALAADVTTKDDLVHSADTALYERKFGRPPRRSATTAVAADPPATAGIDDVVRALALAVDAKDAGTSGHCETVAQIAVAAGRALRLDGPELEALRRAALLHDVGKIGTPDAVLLKPGRLTDEEFRVMKEHPGLGYRIVRSAGLPDREAAWVLHHHEHLDGSGYPHGLRGEEIPLQSRIILVADAFEAMTSDRPYRRGRPDAEAIAELRRCAGRQFDPAIVEVVASIIAARDGGALTADLVPEEAR
jgi:diguanylate cyclase (GGDEF)-like protein/putative nucleotidyltransferase with HDIG domain